MNWSYFKKRLFQVLFRGDGELSIKNIKYLPRWMVVILDLLLSLASLAVAYSVVTFSSLNFYEVITIPQQMAIVFIVQLLFFGFFGTYAGLIRHSTAVDMLKIAAACGATGVVTAIGSYCYFVLTGEKIFLIPFLILYTTIVFSGMLLFRMLVKSTYALFKNYNTSLKKRMLLLGVNDDTISIGEAMKISNNQEFELAGFISLKGSHANLKILGRPVYKFGERFFRNVPTMDVDGIVMVMDYVSMKQKNNLVDRCLSLGLEVFTAPNLQEWTEGSSLKEQIKEVQIEDLLERSPIELDTTRINGYLNRKVILVTGGAGSIGSEIVRQVSQFNPKRLIILDQAESPLHELEMEMRKAYPKSDLEFVLADIRNKGRMEELFAQEQIQVVFHAAAYKHVPLIERNPTEAVFVNILGTMDLADLAIEHQVTKFVMVSTDKAVNPTNVMGATKRAAEMYVQSLQKTTTKTKFITTRFGNVLGSNGSVIPHFKKQIQEGGPVTVTHQDIIRYFMTIPEACQLVLQAGTMGKGGEVFVFDMGKPVRIMDLAERMIKLSGLRPYRDIDITITGLRPGEKLYEELLNDASTTLPTHHEKIMVARDVDHDIGCVRDHIIDIAAAAQKQSVNMTVAKIKALVPEFVSQNSVYEILDSQVQITK